MITKLLPEKARNKPAHLCHAINCTKEIFPMKFMCSRHWEMVPKELQKSIYENYTSGQCEDKKPSKKWLFSVVMAIKAVLEKENS